MERRLTKRYTADHEAAHAVVGLVLGLSLASATIYRENGEWGGHCSFYRTKTTRIGWALMLLAGSAAGHLWHGYAQNGYSGGDLDIFERSVWKHRHPRAEIGPLSFASNALVMSFRKTIRTVARQLMRDLKVSGRDIAEIVVRTNEQPHLLGSPYLRRTTRRLLRARLPDLVERDGRHRRTRRG